MADVRIEFDDNEDDEDEGDLAHEQEGGDTSFNPSDFTVGPAAPANAPVLDPNKKQKALDSDVLLNNASARDQKASKRKLQQEAREQSIALKAQLEDQRRAIQYEKKQARRESQDAVREIRSGSVNKRIQAYTAASALGFPGYVVASGLDQFVFQKQEKDQVSAQQRYQQGLERYNRGVETDLIRDKRNKEAAIRNAPITATNLSAIAESLGVPLNTRGPVVPPSEPPVAPPEEPSPRLPLKPTTPASSNLGTGVTIAAFAFKGAQELNNAYSKLGKDLESYGKGLLGDSATKGLSSGAHLAKKSFDPLGVSVPAQVAVSGFDLLLTLTEEIRKNSEKDLGFSPSALSASVEGRVSLLLQQIDIAQKLDPLKAAIIKQTTQLDLMWNEFRSEIFQTLGPEILTALKYLNATVKLVHDVGGQGLAGLGQVLSYTSLVGFLLRQYLESIEKNTRKEFDKLDNNNIGQQIEDFLNPDKFKRANLAP